MSAEKTAGDYYARKDADSRKPEVEMGEKVEPCALDKLLMFVSLGCCLDEGVRSAARAELAKLRKRAADLELMLRAATRVSMPRIVRRTKGPHGKTWDVWEIHYLAGDEDGGDYTANRLQVDGTGLPLLDDPARSALKGK